MPGPEDVNRFAIFALLLVVLITQIGVGIIAPILSVYAIELGATGVTIGLMVAGFSIARGILQPIVGNYSDRLGQKRFLVAGLVTYAVAAVTYTFAGSVGHLVLIRLFHGVGSAMTVPMAMAIMAGMSPKGKEGRYMGIFNVAMFAGIGGGPLVGGVFRDLWGMNSAFYAMAITSLLAMTLVLILLPARAQGQENRPRSGILTTLKSMLGNRKISGTLLLQLAAMPIMSLCFGYLPILMTRVIGATGFEIGAVVAIRTITNTILQPVFGRMADKGHKLLILGAGSAVVSVLLFFVPSAISLVQFLVLFLLIGAAEAAIWPTLGSYVVEEGRNYGQGSMMGVFNMAVSAGILIGSMGGGLLMDLSGIEFAFYGVGAFLAMCAVISIWLIYSGQRSERMKLTTA